MALAPERFSPIPRNWVSWKQPAALGYAALKSRAEWAFEAPEYDCRITHQPSTGTVIAALKLYLMLVMMADDKKHKDRFGPFHVRTTYDELQGALMLSRAMVSRGLRLLEETDAIRRKSWKPVVYEIVNDERGHFKIPKGHLYGDRRRSSKNQTRLADLPSRGENGMNALIIYLLLLSVCQRDDNVSLIKYTTIEQRTKIPRHKIRKAIDILVNHELISVLRAPDEATLEAYGLPGTGKGFGTPNVYLLQGIGGRKYNERINTLPELFKEHTSMNS